MSRFLKFKSSDIINNVIFFFLFLIISNTAEWCFNQNFIIIIFGGILLIFLGKKLKVDFIAVLIAFYWFFINMIYCLIFSDSFNFNRILGPLLLLGITYMSIKIIGKGFWERFEKWIFYLTYISLFFFFFQLIFPDFFERLSVVFGNYMADFYKETRPNAWYIFFYTYSPILGLSYIRNSGFMWEPGAFAMIVVIAILYRWFKYGVKIDKHTIIYFIAIFSTMSTAGYLSLIMIFVIFMIKEKKVWRMITYVILLLISLPFVMELDFMNDKINNYITSYHESREHQNVRLETIEYDRFSVFAINLKRTLEYPLGYGAYTIKDDFNSDFVGVNGLAVFMRMWGVLGLVYLMYAMFLFLKRLNDEKSYLVLLGMSVICIMFFSNPVERSPLLYLFVFSSFLWNKKRLYYG